MVRSSLSCICGLHQLCRLSLIRDVYMSNNACGTIIWSARTEITSSRRFRPNNPRFPEHLHHREELGDFFMLRPMEIKIHHIVRDQRRGHALILRHLHFLGHGAGMPRYDGLQEDRQVREATELHLISLSSMGVARVFSGGNTFRKFSRNLLRKLRKMHYFSIWNFENIFENFLKIS